MNGNIYREIDIFWNRHLVDVISVCLGQEQLLISADEEAFLRRESGAPDCLPRA